MTTLQIIMLVAATLLVVGVLFYNFISFKRLKRQYFGDEKELPAPKPIAIEPQIHPIEPVIAEPPNESDEPDEMAEAVLRLQLGEHGNVSSELAQKMLNTPGKYVRILWKSRAKTGWVALTEITTICAYLNEVISAPKAVAETGKSPSSLEDTLAFCVQLAATGHVTTVQELEAFQKHVHGIAKALSAQYTPFDVTVEADRAHALDRVCAQLDMQIALTLHGKVSPIPGTQLLLTAQKQGFVLERGALRFRHHDAELFRIETHDGKPLTDDFLKSKAIQNPVVLLDIPKVPHPELAFDELRRQTLKLTQTLAAQLIDDNTKPINEQGLELLRSEVQKSTHAMRQVGIEPGSARALRLFAR
ncbi:MAG: hypothetical protein LBG61_05790 [Burkholderiales bacterium]|jgi:hypothetical protein|nr:hypothetical protein [Burkholderiales bacterium]